MLNAAGVSRTAHQERRRASLATPDVNGIQMDWRPDQAAIPELAEAGRTRLQLPQSGQLRVKRRGASSLAPYFATHAPRLGRAQARSRRRAVLLAGMPC